MTEETIDFVNLQRSIAKIKNDYKRLNFYCFALGQRIAYGLIDLDDAYDEANNYFRKEGMSMEDSDRSRIITKAILEGEQDGKQKRPIGFGDLDLEYHHVLGVLSDTTITPQQRFFEASIILQAIKYRKPKYSCSSRLCLEVTGVRPQTVQAWQEASAFKYLSRKRDKGNLYPSRRTSVYTCSPIELFSDHSDDKDPFNYIPYYCGIVCKQNDFYKSNVSYPFKKVTDHWEQIQFFDQNPGPLWPHQNLWLHKGSGKGVSYLIFLGLYLNGPMTITELCEYIGRTTPKTVRKIINDGLLPMRLIEVGPSRKTETRNAPITTYRIVRGTAFSPVDEKANSIPDVYGKWQTVHGLERQQNQKHSVAYKGYRPEKKLDQK